MQVRISTATALTKAFSKQTREPKLDNRDALKNSGTDLEALVSTAACVASHAGGVKGVEFSEFVLQFVAELRETTEYQPLTWQNALCFGASTKVPFLTPPSTAWPDDLMKTNNKNLFGALRRTRDKERIDLNLAEVVTAEAKNYKSKLETSDMTSILVRAQCKLHLVVCNQIQDKYYTGIRESPTWTSTLKEHEQLAGLCVVYVSVNAETKKCSWALLPGTKRPHKIKKLVIVIARQRIAG
eukprot:c13186_g2_i1.p1 GENE.c13186_g2_i1~~c13186_g2_i1.p1  ORF type:complete len:241 (-),score=65.96 c13186_g2_i1:132-854(-)